MPAGVRVSSRLPDRSSLTSTHRDRQAGGARWLASPTRTTTLPKQVLLAVLQDRTAHVQPAGAQQRERASSASSSARGMSSPTGTVRMSAIPSEFTAQFGLDGKVNCYFRPVCLLRVLPVGS